MERHVDPLMIVLVVVRAGKVLKLQAAAQRVVNESAVGESQLGVGVGLNFGRMCAILIEPYRTASLVRRLSLGVKPIAMLRARRGLPMRMRPDPFHEPLGSGPLERAERGVRRLPSPKPNLSGVYEIPNRESMLKNMVETKPKLPVHEQHFTPDELAEEWHISANTVRRWCEEFGGVLEIDRPEEMHKRGYTSIRIPQSTAEKIYAKYFISISRAA